MQVVVATWSLAGLGGTETYAITAADHLQRLGHDVWLHSRSDGRASALAERLGLRFARDEDDLPESPDALIVHDAAVACEMAARYPLTPQLFVAHSDIFDLQLPPQLPDLVAAVVVHYDRVEQRIRGLALPHDVVRLTQPIDVDRFKPTRSLPERARVAMTLGNYVHGERLALLERACERAGLELRHVGIHATEGERPSELVLSDADVVFGKARVILEAMACGRAAFVFDHNGGEGWVTADSYPLLAPDNFGGQKRPIAFDEETLVAELARYDPGMGMVNRDLAVAHHAATRHAAALVEVLSRLVPRPAPVDAPLTEMARLIRLYHRADSQAFALRAEAERLNARAHELAVELNDEREHRRDRAEAAERASAEAARQAAAAEQARAEAAARAADAGKARADAEQARADAEQARTDAAQARAEADAQGASAGRAWHELGRLKATRRWRLTQAALQPADRVRRLSRRRAAATPLPAPFIVGVGRSGTTLLRMLLDSHPDLAIPPETGFGQITQETRDADELLAAAAALETWLDLNLDAGAARAALADVRPWSTADGLRALYRSYAQRHGKPRWGDKTPSHILFMSEIAASLPEARFIHLIRDGRDVAASVRGLPFAPGDGSIEAIARHWRHSITDGRRAGANLPHYREVRYERLVAEPEATLRELCEFVDLRFEPQMLRAHERAAERLAELAPTRSVAGTVVTRAERLANHALLTQPPDPARAGRWREALSADDVARFEAIAGDLLADLGYDVAARDGVHA